MQNRGDAECSAEIFTIGGKLLKSFGDGAEEHRVKLGLVLKYNGAQSIRHGKDHMEIRDVEQIIFLIVDPSFFSERLAFGAMAVAAGIVRNIDNAAAFAFVQMRTQFSGTTFSDSGHGFKLFI